MIQSLDLNTRPVNSGTNKIQRLYLNLRKELIKKPHRFYGTRSKCYIPHQMD